MATIAGTIKDISNGIFHVKDENGNIKVLNVGDTIYENDTVYGDSTNSTTARIEIELSGNDVIVLSEGQEQLIDSSLIETAFGREELFFTREGLDLNIDSYKAQEDVVSDLRDAQFKNEKPEAIDENAKNDGEQNEEDVTEEETAEGEEEAEDETTGEAQFQVRDADATNVESDLRDATFKARTQNFIDRELFRVESEDRLSFDDTESFNPFTPTSPTNPITPTNPSTPNRPTTPIEPDLEIPEDTTVDIIPPIEQPVSNITLSINDVSAYESEGFLVFNVSLNRTTSEDITFNYKTSQLTATANEDYKEISGTITIAKGDKTAIIKVPIEDDYFADNGETLKVTISDVIGDVEVKKPEGIGTILDNSNPSNPEGEPGGYEEQDSIYAIIVGPDSVSEGDTTTEYTVKLVDKDGNPVVVTEDMQVTVSYKNDTTQDGDTQYNDGDTISVTIFAGNSQNTFDVETIKDEISDDAEDFNLSITNTQSDEFENVVLGDKDGNYKDVTTTIFDSDEVFVKITNNDISQEGEELEHTISLYTIDNNGNEIPFIIEDNETITITLGYTPSQTDGAEEGVDYTGTTTVVFSSTDGSSKTIQNPTIDDYFNENDESYIVAITDISQENNTYAIFVDEKNSSVTGTIQDNEPNETTPDEGSYGSEDTIYAIIQGPSSVNEGDTTTQYTVKLIDENGNEVIVTKDTHVTVVYKNVTTQNADTQYNEGDTIDVTISQNNSSGTFTVDTIDDYLADNGENYNLSITDVEETGEFENVEIGDKDGNFTNVSTTILDNTNPSQPGSETGGYGSEDTIYAIIQGPSSVNEGDTTTQYTVKLIDENGNEVVVTKDTQVTVVYKNITTQDADTEYNENDTISVTIGQNSSTGTFTVDTIDDYLADNGENYNLSITDVEQTGEFENVEIGDKNGNFTNVTTSILDNSQPDTPTDLPDDTIEADKEIVVIKLFAADENGDVIKDGNGNYQLANSVDEGNTANYIAYAFEKGTSEYKDSTKLQIQGGSIDVNFNDDEAKGIDTQTKFDGTQDFENSTKTINIGESFITDTLNDVITENSEVYNVTLDANTYVSNDGNGYESVEIDTTPVETTINDFTAKVFVKIEPVIDTTYEGDSLEYKVSLVDENGNVVTIPTGKSISVDLSYSDFGANPAETEDYTKVNSVTITGGNSEESFTLPTLDDFYAEGDEGLSITIGNITGDTDIFENILLHTVSNGASEDKITTTGTIKDNPANTKQPTDENNTDSSTGSYDEDDTVYVKITENDSVYEGNTLSHTVTLVDKDGTPITVPAGETITVTLSYSNDTTENVDYDGSTKTTQVTITSGNFSTVVENPTIDDFVVNENGNGSNENYTLTITDVSQNNDTYENIAIDTDNDSVTGEIKDGVTLGVPTNAYVDEDNFDITLPSNEISDTKSLNISAPNADNEYKLLFDTSVVAKDPDTDTTITLTSNGQDITFDYSTEGKIIATRDDNKVVFEITLNKNLQGGADDNYTYKQYENIDHPDANVDDNVVLTFGYKIQDQGETSSVQNFTVTVNDSMPSGTSQNVTLDEDSSKLIVISDESFLDGDITLNNGVDGDTVVSNGNSIDIYDNLTDQVKIGTLTNNGDGTLTFTPEADYSGTTAGFTYNASDNDGDSAGSTVSITVNPIADKPDMNGANAGLNEGAIKTTPQVLEDNNNDAGVESGALYKATIGLILPQATDIVDLTNNIDNDQPEKLGLITLSSSANQTVIIDGVEHSIDSNGITIFINDIADYHYSGIDTSGAISITQAQFEAIEVKFENDNAVNPKFTISVDEYEVNDDNTLKVGVAKASNSQDYEVDILAVTDPVTLQWNDDPSNLGSFTSNTFTFDNVDEGYGTIDLKALLTNTNGLETDADGDLDGSEHRSYTITGIPEGTIITIGSNSVAADSTGTATINFPDNTADDPEFTMTIAEQFSGNINGTITLNVTDTDDDSTGAITTQSASVDFTMNVNPIADPVTLKVAQAQGFEDAGRTNSNDESTNAELIDALEDGIELYINVISDDNKDIPGATSTDAKEEYNVTINGVPDGGSLYVWNNDSSEWVLVDNSTDLSSYNDLSLINNGDNTWQITINDYQNDKLPKFIPPYNSDDDYTFDISAVSFDNPDTSIAQTLQIDVTVDEVADVPINDDLNEDTVNDDENDTNSFTLVSTEDNGGINLKAIFNTPADLDSNDGESGDGSETLTFKVTGLADGFYINGATFIGGTGSSRVWLVDKTELNNDNVTLQTPTHYAGQVDFQIQFVTTEDAGDSKTHAVKDINAMITPVTEGHIASSDTQDEDGSKVLNFDFISPDTDGTDAGEESLESFSINVTGLEAAGITLVSNGVDLTTGKTGYQTVTVTNGVADAVTATLTEDIDSDYSFNITYTYKDVALDNSGNTYTDTKTVTDQLYSVTVNAITDDINLDMSTTTGANNSVDGSGNVTVTDNGSFTKTLTVTGIDSDGRGSADTDSSEEFTRVTVSGVPEGITITDGVYAGDTGGGNYSGYWYVDIANEALDADGATYDLVFNVDGSFDSNDLGDYEIIVTTYNQEQNNDVEQSDSESFTLTIDTEITGPGPGIPATIVAFYQDIDNDGTHDHDYEVSTTINTNITDSDAYEESVVREDTQFQLSDVVYVETDTTGATSTAFSITLKNVPEGVDIQGMTLNANGFYTLSGYGDQTAIVSKLQSILITPKLNENTNASDITNTDLDFDIELTTYASGGAANNALINFTASVLPITDEMDLTVVNDGSTNEDIAQTFSITLDNDADGINTQIVDGKVYLKLTENYSDLQGADGDIGVLSYEGSVITATFVSGVSGITDGDYYVIDSVNYNDTLEFSYNPASNRDGSISVDVYVKNVEGETWSSYDTTELVSHKTISFSVDSVIDGFTLGSGTTISGTEDELVPLSISLTSDDSSEKLSSVSLSGLPDGFLLFYGESSDGSDKSLANNLGVDGTTTIQMTYGVDETVDVNRWNIPLTDGKLPTYIWVQTPENWSGVIPDLSIIAVDEYGNIFPETIASGSIDPVVDTLTLNATQTFGKEGEDILLNLNANVEDLDGSETVTLTLTGFGDGDANFKASGNTINSSYDSGSDTYTIEGIDVNDINALTVTHETLGSTSIDVNAKMVESDGTESALVNDSFDISISQSVASAGDNILLLKDGISFDGLAGTDTLVINGKTLDSSKVSNIEILDLNAADNNISLTLNDILDMTDNDNEIEIIGDNNDTFSLTTTGWTQGTVTDNGDNTTYEYSDGSNTVKLTVDDNINTSGL